MHRRPKRGVIPAAFIHLQFAFLYYAATFLILQVLLAPNGFAGPSRAEVTEVVVPTPTLGIRQPDSGLVTIFAASENQDWWQVYFTNPDSSYDAADLSGTVLEGLIELIEGAEHTILIAAFEFDVTPIAETLIDAHNRGVDIEWITDQEYGLGKAFTENKYQFQLLENAGIEIKGDGRTGLMHNKFLIIDDALVWTGSLNITLNGAFRNNNNVVLLNSPEIAQAFENEFNEMWAGQFGITSPSTVAAQRFEVEGTPIQVLFAPEDGVARRLARLLENAESSIHFMAYSFTENQMGQTILARHDAGVPVRGIFEARGSLTPYSHLTNFFCAGIEVRQDGNPQTFHHKVLVIDGEILVTGSFNFSRSADKDNDENVLVITNKELAAAYLQEFNRRWAEAAEPSLSREACP